MYPTLLHIYGPLYIYSYGFMIVLGLVIYSWFTLNNPRHKGIVTTDQFFSIVSWAIISGLVGGHLLSVITEDPSLESLLSFDGFSILGTIIGVIAFLLVYFAWYRTPVLPLLDFFSAYAPIIQGFGRIGCFLAGCCYGKSSTMPWAITYTNSAVEAPLCIALHPSQLYSALLLFGIAIFLGGWLQYRLKKPGYVFGFYVALISIERFVIDFFRYDHTSLISPYQVLSLLLLAFSTAWLIALSYRTYGRK